MRRHTLLWSLVLGLTTAVVASAGAARRDFQIMLAIRPSVTGLHQPVTVNVTAVEQGSWVSREPLSVQFKECGLKPAQFRDTAEVRQFTDPWSGKSDGNWSATVTPMANGTFRATIDPNVVSNEVRVKTRADVRLAPTTRGRYRASVDGRLSFRRKHVRIERYDPGRSRWVLVRTVVLGHGVITGSPQTYISARTAEFALRLPAGTGLRAVFPLSQAKPCYAAGTSKVVQK